MRTIEDRFNTMGGQIVSAATQLSWLIDALGAIANAEGGSGSHADRLARLASRLPWGVNDDAVSLVSAAGPRLSRAEAIALHDAGFSTLEALANIADGPLEIYLGPESVCRVMAWSADYAPGGNLAMEGGSDEIATTNPVLVIDESRPGEIVVDDRVVALQPKQFDLMCLLAQTPGKCVGYETIYNALWGDVFVEQSQMHYQKRTLLQRIQEVCPGRERGLIKTRNRYGYALELPAHAVVYRPVPAGLAAQSCR